MLDFNKILNKTGKQSFVEVEIKYDAHDLNIYYDHIFVAYIDGVAGSILSIDLDKDSADYLKEKNIRIMEYDCFGLKRYKIDLH